MEENKEIEKTEETPVTFESFGLRSEIMQGVREAGFTEATPIQVKAIPYLMEGRDLIGQALTGTGKTAAFGLPIMDKLVGASGLRCLVLVPTRELAAQVSAEFFRLGRHAGLHTAAFTGGQSYSRQEKLLDMGIDVLVATPGRLIDLIDSGHFKGINPPFMVVDEADEMLDMGFIDDVKKIFAAFPGPRQTMLFSATMPRPVVELAETILKDPIKITTAVDETANNDIEQLFFVIEDRERTDAIVRLIDAQEVGKAIIFCRTKEEADGLNIILGGRGYNVNCLHGDMEQAQRSRVMAAFRRGEIDILVATDVAARGLDVDDVTHVFNYHLPFDSRGYVHRIGRTGRAGKSGTAITLVTPREMRQLEAIKRTVGAQIENRLIPTRTEVTSLRLKKIFHDLHDYKLDMNILNQVQTLSVNQDLMVLLAKLIGHSLSGGADQGPEHIGLEGEHLTDVLEHRSRRRREERRDRQQRRDRRDERKARRDGRDDFRRTPPEERSEFEDDFQFQSRNEKRLERDEYRETPPEERSIYEDAVPVYDKPAAPKDRFARKHDRNDGFDGDADGFGEQERYPRKRDDHVRRGKKEHLEQEFARKHGGFSGDRFRISRDGFWEDENPRRERGRRDGGFDRRDGGFGGRRDDFGGRSSSRGFTGNARTDLGKPGKSRSNDGRNTPKRNDYSAKRHGKGGKGTSWYDF
ncbi:MAG: DEAD/DEAH box helicase [Victivallales bacterium]|nr:DEAD/DEAH box helicase [Victivallales bacterium]